MAKVHSLVRTAGAEKSREAAQSIAWDTQPVRLNWLARIAVPFSYAASKNHLYASRCVGHISLREETNAVEDAIAERVRNITQDQRIAHNKVWVDLLIQKNNHKGDAINFLEVICDGIKRGLGIDDRWFCIRKLDWEIVKIEPMMFIGFGQASDVDCQVCCYCGQIKPFHCFGKRKTGHLGIARECKDCKREGQHRAAAPVELL